MAVLADEVLVRWREAEELLRFLPPDAPERPPLAEVVEEMRNLHRDITDAAAQSHETIARARDRLQRGDELLAAARGRLVHASPAYPRECEGPGPHEGSVTYRLADGRMLCVGCLRRGP